MLDKNKHIELFNQGLVYRYSAERWKQLERLPATQYGSLKKIVTINGQSYVDELIQPLAYPMALLSREVSQLADLAAMWEIIVRLQMELAKDGWLTDGTLADYGVDNIVNSSDRSAWADAGYDEPLMPFIRLDLIRTTSGFKIVDINSTRPAGLGDNLVLDAAYKGSGQWNHFSPESVFSQTIKVAFDSWRRRQGTSGPARIAIILGSVDEDWHNFENLRKVLAAAAWVNQVKIFTAWPAEELGNFNCIIRGRIKETHQYYSNLSSLPLDRFCLISPLGRRFVGNKKWFWVFRNQLLGDLFAECLGQEKYRVLKDSCLETGILRPGGLVQLSDEKIHFSKLCKNDWMIKPPAGSSGRGIIVGARVQKDYWNHVCSQEESIGSVWQLYQPVKEIVVLLDKSGQPVEEELHTKYGAYLFNGQLAGVEVMARSSPLVHGARNTYLSTAVWA